MTNYLVVAVVAFILYYIGREVFGAFRHLPDETLVRYWNGELKRTAAKAHRRATEHLATCESCKDRLDHIRKNNAGPGAADPMISRRY